MTRRLVRLLPLAALVVGVFLLAVGGARAQDGRGYRASSPPWYAPGYQGYHEPAQTTPLPETPTTPHRYTLQITALPQKYEDNPNSALVMAHLPEDALIWFQDNRMKQTGTLRHFVTPPLTPGKEYMYTVRVQWPEEGRLVSQVHTFAIQPGDIHCIDIVPTESQSVRQTIAANLAKLDPGDRKAADDQRFCVVQEGIRLGSMGVPFKTTTNGETIFVCCEGCADKARDHPEQTLQQLKKLKAKYANATDK